MKTGNISGRLAAALCLILLASPAAGWCSQKVDNSIYARLLKNYVKSGVVDYAGLKKDEAEVNRYLKLLEATKTKDLSKNKRLAFYINAYNINAIKVVLTGYPGIHSIKDMGSIFRSVWTKKVFVIDGKPVSLDDIESGVRSPEFHDPRVHFAINCASKSCPPLESEPYEGDTLDRRLDASAKAFINDPHSNFLKGNTLYLSKIFDWYSKDFKRWSPAQNGENSRTALFGGGVKGAVLSFIMKYANPDLKKKLRERAATIKIDYLPYDWTLDGK